MYVSLFIAYVEKSSLKPITILSLLKFFNAISTISRIIYL